MTATNDQVFRTASDPDVAFWIDPTKITCAQIFVMIVKIDVFIRLCIGVARVDAGTRDTDFTNFVRGAFDRPITFLRDDFHVIIGEWKPDRAHAFFPIHRVDRDKNCCFCQTVTFNNLNACRLCKTVEEFQRHRSRA